jgi:ATP-binding protein involved in chromosome partitioning
MPEEDAFTPVAIVQEGPTRLGIRWADGHASSYEVRALRLACGCAVCVDEWTGEGRLDESAVPAEVRPVRIQPVGRYAIQIAWSDGHETGIHPFRRLRELCACAACQGRARGGWPPPSAVED